MVKDHAYVDVMVMSNWSKMVHEDYGNKEYVPWMWNIYISVWVKMCTSVPHEGFEPKIPVMKCSNTVWLLWW